MNQQKQIIFKVNRFPEFIDDPVTLTELYFEFKKAGVSLPEFFPIAAGKKDFLLPYIKINDRNYAHPNLGVYLKKGIEESNLETANLTHLKACQILQNSPVNAILEKQVVNYTLKNKCVVSLEEYIGAKERCKLVRCHFNDMGATANLEQTQVLTARVKKEIDENAINVSNDQFYMPPYNLRAQVSPLQRSKIMETFKLSEK